MGQMQETQSVSVSQSRNNIITTTTGGGGGYTQHDWCAPFKLAFKGDKAAQVERNVEGSRFEDHLCKDDTVLLFFLVSSFH